MKQSQNVLGKLRDFQDDRSGTVAAIFGLSVLMIAMTVGLAIDYGRAHATKIRLQNALDAAVLAAAKKMMMSGDKTTANIDSAVQTFFALDQPTNHLSSIVTIKGFPNGTDGVRGEATAELPTTFMQLTGITKLQIYTTAEASFGTGDAEVALVLDTTGSMSGTKLDTLKTAAKDLIDTVYAQPGADSHVKFALVPFAQYVNVGLGNRNAPWMNVPLDTSTTSNACSMVRPVISTSNCRMEDRTGTNDGVPYTYQTNVCDKVYGDEEEQCNDVTSTYTWRGCAGSRDHPLNTQDGNYATRIPGPLNHYCPAEIVPLSPDANAIKGGIDAMTASGQTYIPSGLAWGWRALSHLEPFAQGADPASATNVRKFIVLMTDGANTKSTRNISANFNDHYGTDVANANTVTTELCNNIKAEKIEIYSIAFDVTDVAIKDILRGCASPGGAFYDAADSAQLTLAFQDIAGSLNKLRLSK